MTLFKNYSVQTMRLLIGGAMVVFMVALAFAPILTSVASAQEGFGGSAGIRPAYPREDNIRTKDIWVHTAEPGTEISEGVRAINDTDKEALMLIYAVDEVLSSGRAFGCRSRSYDDVDVGSWISFPDADENGDVYVSVPPLSEILVPFTIAVPESADTGEHNGCIVVEDKSGTVNSNLGLGFENEAGEASGGAKINFRRGIRAAILVPGDTERSLEIVDMEMTLKDNGNLNFQSTLKNIGNVSVDADIFVRVKNSILGYEAGKTGGQYPILRNTEPSWNFEFQPPFWGGWYTAQLEVAYDPSPDTELGVRIESQFITIFGPTAAFYANPALYAIGIYAAVIVLLLILIIWILLVARQKMWIKKSWIKYSVKDGEDIQVVAKANNVSWRLLVRANKLDAPYSIEAGHELIVPPAKGVKSKGEEPVSE